MKLNSGVKKTGFWISLFSRGLAIAIVIIIYVAEMFGANTPAEYPTPTVLVNYTADALPAFPWEFANDGPPIEISQHTVFVQNGILNMIDTALLVGNTLGYSKPVAFDPNQVIDVEFRALVLSGQNISANIAPFEIWILNGTVRAGLAVAPSFAGVTTKTILNQPIDGTSFHDYRFELDPTGIRWWVDGNPIGSAPRSALVPAIASPTARGINMFITSATANVQLDSLTVTQRPANVALASSGATTQASLTFNNSFPPEAAINGDRKGLGWGAGGGWNDASLNTFPDWLEVDFNDIKSIQEIDVFTLQDDYTSPIDPTPTTTFSLYGLTDFEVQYWNGTDWLDVPGGFVTGNNLVWRKFNFSPLSTTRIRVLVNGALNGYSRITEIEAYGPYGLSNIAPSVQLDAPSNNAAFSDPATIPLRAIASDIDGTISKVDFYSGTTLIATSTSQTNTFTASWNNVPAGNYVITAVATDNLGAATPSLPANIAVVGVGLVNFALTSNGGTVAASSTNDSTYPAASAINGDRRGLAWGTGGGWNDASLNAFPDWLEVDFNDIKTIQEIDVFTLQDDYTSPIDPTPATTFSLYGLTDFEVQYWNGTDWLDVPGGFVTGNNLVWRKFNFSPFTTGRIRVLVNSALNGYSRITEIEAYGFQGVANNAPAIQLNSPVNRATFSGPATISLSATASDSDGTVSKVDFYSGTTLVATSTSQTNTFTAAWNNVPAGNYVITAVATDNLGAKTISSAVNIRVSMQLTSLNPAQWGGLRSSNGGASVGLLSFSAVVNNPGNNQDRTIIHFDISTLAGVVPTTFLDIPVANLDAGPPLGSLALYSFQGDGTVSTDEWNAGSLLHTFTGISGELINGQFLTVVSVDVTSVLQDAVNNFVPYLSFNLRQSILGGDRFFLGSSIVVVLPAPSLNARASQPGPVNVALASSGAVALASSTFNSSFDPANTINGDRRGLAWGAGGGWNDLSPNSYPDWLEIDFNDIKTIQEIDVFTLQDDYTLPIEPTQATQFSLYGLKDFQIQFWTGTDWADVPAGVVTGNNLVWRKFNFSPFTTGRIRVLVNSALNGYSRITEVEAWTPGGVNSAPTVSINAPGNNSSFAAPAAISLSAQASDSDGTISKIDFYAGTTLVATSTSLTNPFSATWNNVSPGSYVITAVATDNLGAVTHSLPVNITVTGMLTNVALAANGTVVIASSNYSSSFSGSGAINGDRLGLAWGAGGGWNDLSPNSYPDWLEIHFNDIKKIQEINVFTLQDNPSSPADPTPTMTFSLYGLTNFQVQYWNGTDWLDVPGGFVTGNNLVWRKFSFSPIATSSIRVLVNGALNGYSRITEVEAYAAP